MRGGGNVKENQSLPNLSSEDIFCYNHYVTKKYFIKTYGCHPPTLKLRRAGMNV